MTPSSFHVDILKLPSDAGRARPRPWLRAMGRAAAVAADTNGTDHCLGPLVLKLPSDAGRARPRPLESTPGLRVYEDVGLPSRPEDRQCVIVIAR